MKKKRLLKVLSVTAILSLSLPTLSYAGEWKQDNKGWWWVYDDGSYPISKWEWIDGNHDGIAECYYFDSNGYMAVNTIIDGSIVNSNGAWTVDGVVQTKSANPVQVTGWNGYFEQEAIHYHALTYTNTIKVISADDNEVEITIDWTDGISISTLNNTLKYKNAEKTQAFREIWALDALTRGSVAIGEQVFTLTDKGINVSVEAYEGRDLSYSQEIHQVGFYERKGDWTQPTSSRTPTAEETEREAKENKEKFKEWSKKTGSTDYSYWQSLQRLKEFVKIQAQMQREAGNHEFDYVTDEYVDSADDEEVNKLYMKVMETVGFER